jgi:short-subunit dehydrogenase
MPSEKLNCALITGASQGLGRAFAEICASQDMNLLLVALPGSGLPDLARSITERNGVQAEWLEVDLMEDSAIEDMKRLILESGLKPDLLINNAGIGSMGLFQDLSREHSDSTIKLNAIALVRITRLFIEECKGSRNAHILNVASLSAFFPMPSLSVYSATKSFVLNYSLALREELSGRIRVSVLCPNAIRNTVAVCDYIDRLGLLPRLACLTPAYIVRAALEGIQRDKAIIIPGFFNRAVAVLRHVVPTKLAMRTIRHYWGGFGGVA